jgi:hypothetical protein
MLVLAICAVPGIVASLLSAQAPSPPPEHENLALRAKATASETQDAFAPQLALDGDRDTRWSGIPGHNGGVWYELDWDAPVDIGCVAIHQFQRYVTEFDLDAFDDATSQWRTLAHFGNASERLHGDVLWRATGPAAAPVRTSKLRLARIANGPSFTEIEVYADPWAEPPELHASGDAAGHVLGIVTDRFGAAPVAGAKVTFACTTPTGAHTLEATTDEHGLFSLDAPPGLRGAIATRITCGAREFIGPSLAADALPVVLTPTDERTPKQLLNGSWHFAADPDSASPVPAAADASSPFKDAIEVQVPSHLVMHGLEPRDGVAVGRRRFARSPGLNHPGGARVKLRFDGAYSGAEVFVNGTRVAAHEGGATPFEADVTDLLQPDNTLAVRLREHTDTSDRLDRMSQYADFPLLGIWRDVTLFSVPVVHVEAWRTTPRFAPRSDGSLDLTFGMVDVEVSCVNESAEPFTGELTFKLTAPDGQPVVLDPRAASASLVIEPWSRVTKMLRLDVANPPTWDAEHPRRFEVTALLRRRTGPRVAADAPELPVVQHLTRKIGFRQTDVRGSDLLINGATVKLRGTCHHDGDPLVGRAVTATHERRDAELIVGANLNALRTSHYPPHPALLDAADELGIYVEDEASFCWVGDSNDLRLAPRILQLTAELLARDRHHPSVFMWSLCNESEYGWGFARSHEWVRAADPSRPTGAAISATTELATAHNPITLERIAGYEGQAPPLLFDESFCIWQGIWNDVGELWVDPAIRDAWVAPMVPIAEQFFSSKSTHGSMIWCFADDLFCVPGRGFEYGRNDTRSHFAEPAYRQKGRGLVGDAPWGFVDGWRRPRPEYFHMRELFSPVHVVATRGHELTLENRFDHTDFGECTFEWQRGEERGRLEAHAPPHATASVTLPDAPPSTSSKEPRTVLRVADPRGRTVLEREFDADPVPVLQHSDTPFPPTISDEGTLAGTAVRIRGDDFELSFDRSSGALRTAVAGGAPALLEWPRLHVLARTEAMAPRPARNTFRCEGVDVSTTESRTVRVVLRGRFGDFVGSVDAEIGGDGHVRATTHVVNDGPDLDARELGVAMTLPLSATHLSWWRASDGRVFPDDHIGRPRGAAEAFPSVSSMFLRIPRVGPPTWTGALDPSPMGCDDFRSTKRNVTRATLAEPSGGGILVDAGGRQHVRACVEDDRVRLCVLDWSGGSAVGLGEWQHNYGNGQPLKHGATIDASVTFTLLPPETRR